MLKQYFSMHFYLIFGGTFMLQHYFQPIILYYIIALHTKSDIFKLSKQDQTGLILRAATGLLNLFSMCVCSAPCSQVY